MTRRFALIACFATTFAVWATELSAQVLSVDFGRNPPGTPVQPGFAGIAGPSVEASHTEIVGVFTVKVEGDGFFSAGFNAGNVAPAVAALFEDYYYNNSTDPAVGIKTTITGVVPNLDYDVQIWSYDADNIFTVTPTQWGPASGSATTGTTGLVSDSGSAPFPTTLSEKTTTIRLRTTTNELAFFGSSTSGSGGTRLNGFQLSAVPEPSGVLLFGVAGAMFAVTRRKIANRR